MDEATVIAQIVDPDDYEVANAILIVIEEGAEVTITPRPPEGPLSVGDYLPANVVWVP